MKTSTKTAIAVVGGVGVAVVIAAAFEHKAHAAPACKCPDGSPCPGGDTSKCPPPGQLGNNDPDSPPGGWTYNGTVGDPASIAAAIAAFKAAVGAAGSNPACDPNVRQATRNLQAALGLAQINGGPGWNAVNPPGTDGRYGGDVYKAASVYDSSMPQPFYSNSQPVRPSCWGPPGTYT